MNLTPVQKNGVQVIEIDADRIDAAIAIQFKDGMRGLLSAHADRVVLDLNGVEFIDSSGLGAIVASMKLMPNGGKLELADLSPAVDKVFRLTRMDSIFNIHENVDAAVNS